MLGERRLAGPVRPDDGDGLAGRHLQRDVTEGLDAVRVAERDVVERHGDAPTRRADVPRQRAEPAPVPAARPRSGRASRNATRSLASRTVRSCSAHRIVVPVGAQPAEQVDDGRCPGRIELGRRLVEHEEARPHRGDRGDRDPLLLAAGQRARVAIGEVADAEGVHRRLDALVHRRHARDAEVLQPEGEFLADGRLRAGELVGRRREDDPAPPDARRRPSRGQAPIRRPVERRPARRPAARTTRGRSPAAARASVDLPAPVRTGQPEPLAVRDRERDVVERRFAAARDSGRSVRRCEAHRPTPDRRLATTTSAVATSSPTRSQPVDRRVRHDAIRGPPGAGAEPASLQGERPLADIDEGAQDDRPDRAARAPGPASRMDPSTARPRADCAARIRSARSRIRGTSWTAESTTNAMRWLTPRATRPSSRSSGQRREQEQSSTREEDDQRGATADTSPNVRPSRVMASGPSEARTSRPPGNSSALTTTIESSRTAGTRNDRSSRLARPAERRSPGRRAPSGTRATAGSRNAATSDEQHAEELRQRMPAVEPASAPAR